MEKQALPTELIFNKLWEYQDTALKILSGDNSVYDEVFTRYGVKLRWRERTMDGDIVTTATPMTPRHSLGRFYQAVANQRTKPSVELFAVGVEVLMQELGAEEIREAYSYETN